MNKVVVGFVAGAVVVGAAGFGTLVYPQMRAKQQVDAAIASLPANLKAEYRTLDYSLFSGKLTLGDFQMTVQEDGDSFTAKVNTLTMRGLSKNAVGEISGKGLSMFDANETIRLEAADLNAEKLEAPEGVLAGMGTPTAFSLKRLALTGLSMTANQEQVKLGEIVVADYAQTAKMPLTMTLGIHGLQIEPASLPDDEARENLAKLGYDKLSLNFDLSYAHAPETKHLTIRQAAISGDNVGRLGIAFALGGVDTEALGNPATALAAAQSATLESLELRYDDASLVGRMLKLAAQEAQMDEPAFRAMLLAQVAQAGEQAPQVPLTKQVVDSVSAFLTTPKSLSVRMAPAQPLPLMQMMGAAQMDPYGLVQATGLSVSANQ